MSKPLAPASPLPWRVESYEIGPGILNGMHWDAVSRDGVFISEYETKADAEYAVRAANCFPELLAALQECSFRLAALVAASGDFSEVNGKALDAASAAIAKAEERS